ncbi:MAG: DUF2070 family protein [Candidatus Thorarchaeota archaeon]|nr:DUF2070 family protein [Candidatus Thorarchaeota archaeon]
MGEKAKVKETVSLYSKVWQLPTYRGIVFRTIVLAVISAGIISIGELVSEDIGSALLTFITLCSVLIMTAFVGSGLMYLIVRKKGSPLDARRALGSAQFGIIFWFSLGTLGGIITQFPVNPMIQASLWTLGLALGYLVFAFLVTGLSDYHPIRNFIGAMMPTLVWIVTLNALALTPYVLPLLPPFWYISIPIILVIDSITVHYIFTAVSHPFERDLGINGPELLRAFGYDYLVENPEPLETLMTQISVVQDVPMELLVFKEENKPIAAVVILYVHPGPFRDIGSSGLPSEIIHHIKEKHGIQAFVLHGSCTHHQNLTNKIDYEIVMKEIDRLIQDTETYQKMSGPHWTDHGKFKVWSFFVGQDVLAISTSAPEFTDDIALEVGRAAAQAARDSLSEVRYVALSDAHNCIDDHAISVMPGDPEATLYVEAIREAIKSTVVHSHEEFQVGIHQVVPEGISSKEGMGPGGIVALVLKTGDRLSAMVSVDGNNVEPGYREIVQEKLLSEGFSAAEITTTDTHVVNAISLSSKGYPPVGKIKSDLVLDAILRSALQAKENLVPARAGLAFGEAKGLRTFGEKGFDTLTYDVAEAYQIAKKKGAGAGGIAFLISLLLSFLL